MPLLVSLSFYLEVRLSTAPQWTPATKRIILVICLILIGLAIWQFSVVLAPLVVAVIIAYLLNPLVNWLTIRTPLKRRWAATVVYIAFLLVILVLMPTLFAPLIIQQIRQLDIDVHVRLALPGKSSDSTPDLIPESAECVDGSRQLTHCFAEAALCHLLIQLPDIQQCLKPEAETLQNSSPIPRQEAAIRSNQSIASW